MEFDIEAVARTALRRSGRPSLNGDGPSGVVKVRLDVETRTALAERAARDSTTPSAVVRDALRSFLAS